MPIQDSISQLPEVSFAAGERVISEGAEPGKLFFLKSGKAEVSKNGMRIALLKTPGCVVGEISLLLGSPATASVVALEDSIFRSSWSALYCRYGREAADCERRKAKSELPTAPFRMIAPANVSWQAQARIDPRTMHMGQSRRRLQTSFHLGHRSIGRLIFVLRRFLDAIEENLQRSAG